MSVWGGGGVEGEAWGGGVEGEVCGGLAAVHAGGGSKLAAGGGSGGGSRARESPMTRCTTLCNWRSTCCLGDPSLQPPALPEQHSPCSECHAPP